MPQGPARPAHYRPNPHTQARCTTITSFPCSFFLCSRAPPASHAAAARRPFFSPCTSSRPQQLLLTFFLRSFLLHRSRSQQQHAPDPLGERLSPPRSPPAAPSVLSTDTQRHGHLGPASASTSSPTVGRLQDVAPPPSPAPPLPRGPPLLLAAAPFLRPPRPSPTAKSRRQASAIPGPSPSSPPSSDRLPSPSSCRLQRRSEHQDGAASPRIGRGPRGPDRARPAARHLHVLLRR